MSRRSKGQCSSGVVSVVIFNDLVVECIAMLRLITLNSLHAIGRRSMDIIQQSLPTL